MSRFNRKTLTIGLVSLAILATLILINYPTYKNKQNAKNVTTISVDNQKTQNIDLDLNGDGKKETVKVAEIGKNSISMEAFDSAGNKIADLLDGLALYPTTLYKVVELNTKSPKQYLQWNMATGPHQIETVFLTVIDNKIHPIYSFDFEKTTMYSPFYNSRGELVVGDANNDGLSEVIENIDEYPVNAPQLNDPNIEKMIRDEFSKNGLSEEDIQSNIKIVNRENYGKGRGRKVLMAIHSFVDDNPPFFRRLPEKEYNEIADRFIKASEDIANQNSKNTNWEGDVFLKYADLSQDSKDFNSFVRDFWTHNRPYEFPINNASGTTIN